MAKKEEKTIETTEEVVEKELTAREKKLLARKTQLQRQSRQKLPKTLRWVLKLLKRLVNSLIKIGTRFVKNALSLAGFGKLVLNVGVLCPLRLK